MIYRTQPVYYSPRAVSDHKMCHADYKTMAVCGIIYLLNCVQTRAPKSVCTQAHCHYMQTQGAFDSARNTSCTTWPLHVRRPTTLRYMQALFGALFVYPRERLTPVIPPMTNLAPANKMCGLPEGSNQPQPAVLCISTQALARKSRALKRADNKARKPTQCLSGCRKQQLKRLLPPRPVNTRALPLLTQQEQEQLAR